MTENAKTRQNAYFEMAPKSEHFFIHTFRSFQCIRFVEKTILFCRKQRGRRERNFRLCPPSGPQDNLAGPNWHIAHLDHVYYKIRLQLGLWDTYLYFLFVKVPLWGPMGSGLDQNCTCTNRPWGQQNVTINRFLRYLVTEEIEEQDIVYEQTDIRPDDGWKGIA